MIYIYKNHTPKISAHMDPALVQQGESRAKQLGLLALPIAQVKADGTPYLGHNGVDTVGRWDEPIYALPVPDGRVKSVQENATRGNWLEYGNSRITVWQAHFKEIRVVPGQRVTADTVIGIEGATGQVSGKHLHTSIVIDGKRVDPYFYLTGALQLPADTDDGFRNWENTDQWERAIAPKRYVVRTPGGVNLRIRRSPGTDKPEVGVLRAGEQFAVDKIAELPDGQVWARIKGKPWHWVALKRGEMFATELKEWPAELTDGFYFVRSARTDTKSQSGAFKVLKNAQRQAARTGQKVFAPDGSEVEDGA